MFGESFKTLSAPPNAMIGPATPPWAGGNNQDEDEPDMEQCGEGESGADNEDKPSITDLLKNPTKVVCARLVTFLLILLNQVHIWQLIMLTKF
jgi:hypothetical protein